VFHRFILSHIDRVKDQVSDECPYFFVDTHAGLGLWVSGNGKRCLGSPVLLYKVLEKMQLPYHGIAFEIDTDRFEDLQKYLAFAGCPIDAYNVSNNCASRVLGEVADEEYALDLQDLQGILYSDFTGCGSVTDINTLMKDNDMDMLVHFAAGDAKRCRYAFRAEATKLSADKDILSFIPALRRRHWFVTERNPGTAHGFVFLHGSNQSDQPINDDFHPVESSRGHEIILGCLFKEAHAAEKYESLATDGDLSLFPLLREYHDNHPSHHPIAPDAHRLRPVEDISSPDSEDEVVQIDTQETEDANEQCEDDSTTTTGDWNPFT
jgi:hypothetical protein